uniref:Uncharacterized protein n=1 Tax=Lactuca sativa TaxID=4236 RepID=A0A9R1X4F0_LACSA|nr:hypothetical protein LSAT_V11C700354440 [Lactuca sativa]
MEEQQFELDQDRHIIPSHSDNSSSPTVLLTNGSPSNNNNRAPSDSNYRGGRGGRTGRGNRGGSSGGHFLGGRSFSGLQRQSFPNNTQSAWAFG